MSGRRGTSRRGTVRDHAGRLLAQEDGYSLLLGVGLMAVIAALVLVVASATAVYLDVKRLTSLADSAAASAAAAASPDVYYGGTRSGTPGEQPDDDGTCGACTVPGGSPVPGGLTDEQVLAGAIADVQAQAALTGLVDVRLEQAYAEDGVTAVVTLSARSQPPFLPWGVIPSQGFEVIATGSARLTVTAR